MDMILQRANTILYCSQWEATVDFYSETFNFNITHQNDWFVEFQLSPNSFLSIADAKHTSIESVNGKGITLSWQISDVHKVHDSLQEAGIEVTNIKKKWGANLFYFHDPEGHRIELWQPLPE